MRVKGITDIINSKYIGLEVGRAFIDFAQDSRMCVPIHDESYQA